MKIPRDARTWLCILAFVVSFSYACIYRITPSVDARKFHEIAVNLVTKNTFCFDCNVPLAKDNAIRDIGPGYQFFLAGVYKVFGIHTWIIWFLQALMHAAVVYWIWALMEFAFVGLSANKWTRIFPVALYAFHPDIVQSNAMLMADGLFVFLFVGAIMILLPFVMTENPVGARHVVPLQSSWKRAASLGSLIGLLTMVRPTGLPFFLVVIAVLFLKKFWKQALIAIVCFVAVQTPWAIRNARTYDQFVYNSVVGGLDIWVGLYPKGTGEFNLDALPEITERINGLSPDEVDHVSMGEVKKIIREQPLFAIERTVQKFFKLFALTKTSGFWFHYRGAYDQGATVLLSILFNVIMLGLGVAAIALALLKRAFDKPILWVAVVAIAIMAVSPTISVVVNRYRIPMLPFFAVLAGYWLAAAKGRDRWSSLGISAAFLAFCTGVDLWGSFGKVMERLQRIRG